MFKAILAGAVALVTIPAIADVGIGLAVKGYSDFFKRCDLGFETSPSAGIEDVRIVYKAIDPERGAELCEQTSNARSCIQPDDFKTTCDAISEVQVLHVDCRGAGDAAVPCGAITLDGGGAGKIRFWAPVSLDRSGGIGLVITRLGYDPFFKHCKIALFFSGPPQIEGIDVAYSAPIGGGGTFECTANLNTGVNSGSSCSSPFGSDFACADVGKVSVGEITCRDGQGNGVDCPAITLHPTADGEAELAN